jgi:hypothetical protein
MQPILEFISAEVVMLSFEDGGRATPLSAGAYQGHYRPHIVLQPKETRQAKIKLSAKQKQIVDEYLGVAFWSGQDPIPVSQPFTVVMRLIYAPHPAYGQIAPCAEFTIREGSRIVGYGKVIKRWIEKAAKSATGVNPR